MTKTPPKPRQKPRHPPRAGREPLNPRTGNPPDPPRGGSTERWVIIEESYLTDQGRHRRRGVRVDLDEVRRGLAVPSTEDQNAWRQIRDQLHRRVGESMFAIWLEPIELVAIDSEQRLVLAPPTATAAWISERFGRLIAATSSELGRESRFANEAERHAFNASAPNDRLQINPKEATG
ncbi:MAG TPA: DnaA N-terminal domain-containing protein [Solirubrobacteraceae bacterium]|nr:DnaA N-terminal domain-containing protein [Solirubrobacteraceae bacterium]